MFTTRLKIMFILLFVILVLLVVLCNTDDFPTFKH